MTQQEEQPVLLTIRIKTAKWENLKRAHDTVFGEAIYSDPESGLISAKVYRSNSDSNDVMFVSEWQSEEDINKFARTHGERFNEIAGTGADDGEDTIWRLADAMTAKE